jgi:hypothetical protein
MCVADCWSEKDGAEWSPEVLGSRDELDAEKDGFSTRT